MKSSGSFELEGLVKLRVTHEINSDDALCIRFRGGFMGRYGEPFQAYLDYLDSLEELAADKKVTRVECHLEYFEEALSRVQHAIYRMLHRIIKQGTAVTIYATQAAVSSSEHFRMSTLFAQGMREQTGVDVQVVELSV